MMARQPRRRAAAAAIAALNLDEVITSDEDVGEYIDINEIREHQNPSETSSEFDEAEPEVNQLLDINGNPWSMNAPPNVGRRDAGNIFRERPGPSPDSRKDTILETWHLFLTPSMLEEIVERSQEKADQLGISVQLTMQSLKAYIGVLYYRGANHDQKIPISELFSDNYSSFYRTAMTRTLFNIWTKCITFDERSSRDERKLVDNFAAIRDFFETWNQRLRMHFTPSANIVVDEQLIASRCRSPNKIYNPSKPGKYGELVRWVVDGEYRYFLNGDPLTRRPTDPQAAQRHKTDNTAKMLVLNLARPFLDKGRNITGDRFFTSFDLAEELLRRQTTYVGTMSKTKREIPPTLHSNLPVSTSKFVFGGTNKKITLQAYQVKRNRKVYLLSTMHHTSSASGDSNKSDIQLFYNSTKAGVDVLDEMCKNFSTRCRVLRWFVVIFHNILDVTAINTQTIFEIHHPTAGTNNPRTKRRAFLLTLADELVKEHMHIRMDNPTGLSTRTMENLARATGTPNPRVVRQQEIEESNSQRQRCRKCIQEGKRPRNANLTALKCAACGLPICGQHGVKK